MFRRATLEKIDIDSVHSTGYVFQTDMAYRTLQAGLKVVEVPIEFIERERGDSKMSRDVATESLKSITTWGLRERARQVRRKLRRTLEERSRQMSGPRPTTRRRRWVTWLLVLAFVVVPLVEIYVLIQVGQVIGPWWTILLLIADSILGGWLIRREGRRAWLALTTALNSGQMPAKELADGALILVGGTLMLSPGFVTDGLGILLILPVHPTGGPSVAHQSGQQATRGRPDRRTDGRTPRTPPRAGWTGDPGRGPRRRLDLESSR